MSDQFADFCEDVLDTINHIENRLADGEFVTIEAVKEFYHDDSFGKILGALVTLAEESSINIDHLGNITTTFVAHDPNA